MRFSFVKYSKIILLFLGFFIFYPLVTYATISNNPAADTQSWIQLDEKQYAQNGRLLMKLQVGTTVQKPNQSVYIAECVDTADDRICTTGTFAGDLIIYQSDANLKKLQQSYGYVFKGTYDMNGSLTTNPVQSDQDGGIPVIYWESVISSNVNRKFYGVNLTQDSSLPGTNTNDLEILKTGLAGGQQQGSFTVKAPIPTPKKIEQYAGAPQNNSSEEHETYEPDDPRNDPYGRVFDAVSLEPLAGAKVTLFTQRKDGSFSFMSPKETTNAIINPWTTKEDGKFVYLVPSGVYQIQIDLPNYTFPFNPKDLKPSYSKAYYELYYGPGFADKNIVEKNTVEHRDIPVVPKGEPYHAPVKLLGYMSELDKKKENYHVTGRASHPLTIVEIIGKRIDGTEITRILTKITADKWGFFETTLPTSSLQLNETVGMAKLIKVDLTEVQKPVVQKQSSLLISFFEKFFTIFPRSSSFAEKEKPKALSFTFARINPLLNYLEGYAYDTNNTPILNAKVGVYLTGSKKPYYTTQADEKGYYTITSQHLPQINYFITYTTPEGKTYQVSQTQFLEQNSKTILDNHINVNKYSSRISPFSNVVAQEREKFTDIKSTTPSPQDKIKNNYSYNFFIIVIFIILSIIILFFIGTVLYFKRK